MYSDFAEVYDRLMDDVDYAAWSEYYLRILREAGVRPREMAECGCGTGSMSVRFARGGVKVVASDLSGEMLMRAADKARSAGASARFARQDMRELRVPHPVDAVVCACDGVNYLLEDGDALAFFAAAKAALKPGGALAFDVSSPAKLLRMAREGMYGEDREDVTYLWLNRMRGEELVDMELTFFLREEDGRYRRFDERQTQRIYAPETLTALLLQAGFEDVRAYGDRTLSAPGADAERIHFTAGKAKA